MSKIKKFENVLITGASAGIGRELAIEFARNGHNLIISSRRKSTLDKLATEIHSLHGVDVHAIAADLTLPTGPEELLNQIADDGLSLDVLVNNAGMIDVGPFHESSPDDILNLLQLNIVALTKLCRSVVPDFLAQGHGKILNVASLAGFQPIPMMAVYASSKAFVLSLTEALSEELKGSGVSVSALCPGLTKTGMVDEVSGQMNQSIPSIFLSDPVEVAKRGYSLCMKGGVIDVPGIGNQFSAAWAQTQPRWLTRSVSGFFSRQSLGMNKGK